MLQLCLEMSVAQRRGELDIGSPYLAADQFIDRNADVCVEVGQHGKVGLTGTGRANRAGLRGKGVAELLRADPEGAAAATRLFGSAAAPMTRLATAVADGGWDRPAALAVLGLTLLRGMADPAAFVRRARFRLSMDATIASCPVLRTIWHADRRVDLRDREAWLERALRAHAAPVEPAGVRP